jgi:hypothetical protein
LAALALTVVPLTGPSEPEVQVLRMANAGTGPCVLLGYPSVTAVLGGGATVVADTTFSGPHGGASRSPLTAVTISPGSTASARLESLTTSAQACPATQSLRIRLPGASGTATVRAAFPVCGPLQVHPILPSADGSD